MQQIKESGIRLSRMTLGTVQLGMPYGVANTTGKPDETNSFRILDEAVRGGINCFDTAIGYGESERVLGSYFSGKEKPIIVSKLSLAPDENTDEADVEKRVLSQLEGSLERLELDKIPVMLLHTPHALLRYGRAVTKAFEKAVRDGYAERMGISFGAEPEERFRELWAFAREDVYEAVQIPLNIFDHRLLRAGALELMRDAGKTVFVRSVFLQGLLTMEPDRLPEHLAGAGKYLVTLQKLADREGMSVQELAVAFVRGLPGVHSLVVGAETPEQVRANVRMIDATPSISEETRHDILQAFSQVPEYLISPHLWNARKTS
jgi:aryl-alcohol dehydrogenase-like predicted oxidoreductase